MLGLPTSSAAASNSTVRHHRTDRTAPVFFFDRTTRHHRLPELYDELALPSDYLLYERVSLLSDLAVMTECGRPVECAFDGRSFYYHCTGTEPTGADRIEWYCGQHRLGYAEDVDHAVWAQLCRRLPRAPRAKTAYARRALLLNVYALLKVGPGAPGRPVVEWIDHKRLADRSFHTAHDRDLARGLHDRRIDAATGRLQLQRAAASFPTPFDL